MHSMAGPDTTMIQSQLRLVSYRLAQLQERHDQTSNVTKRDVAALISRNDITLARKKVEQMVREDRLSAMLEELESNCNLLLEQLSELGRQSNLNNHSPLLEAVSTLMIVGPHTEIKDIAVLNDALLQLYGAEFAQRMTRKYAGRIPPQIFDAIDRRPPSADEIDIYMTSIVGEYNLSWIPPQLPHQRARVLSEALDQNSIMRIVDVQSLRRMCLRGIPLQPPWLRPRTWKLLFGMLSPHKDSWQGDLHMKRQSYYDMARSLLSRLNASPPPSTPLSRSDTTLLNMARTLSTLPAELDSDLEPSPLCPLNEEAPEGLRIEDAGAVDDRLRMIQRHAYGSSYPDTPPEIQVELEENSAFYSSLAHTTESQPSLILIRGHSTSLIRLMYIHMALHSITSTYLSSILVPLYVAMVQEVEPADLAHVEADTFWLFSELCSEMSDLMEGNESKQWITKFGERLAWADPSLSRDLSIKGLDPMLPHYSYRWITSLLTRTLPLPSVLTIWDGLLSQESTKNDQNLKLEFFLDVCTSMLINARARIFRLGKAPIMLGLWSEAEAVSPSRSTTPVAFDDAFVQGMSFLQDYPILELGGAERILELAVELKERRENGKANMSSASKLGERFLGTVSNFMKTPSVAITKVEEEEVGSDGTPSPEWPDSGTEDVTEKPGTAILGKLGTTVWRGITNQSSMDVPPSPLPPPSPIIPRGSYSKPPETPLTQPLVAQATQLGSKLGNTLWRGFSNQSAMDPVPSPISPLPSSPRSDAVQSPRSPSILWSYTEKFKKSNAAATFSKTGTNLSIRASSFWKTNNPPGSAVSSPGYEPPHHFRTQSTDIGTEAGSYMLPRRGSVPARYGDGYTEEYAPPPRPKFRESKYFSQEEHSSSNSPSTSRASSPPLLAKTKSTLMSFTTGASKPPPRTGPKPLLLNSSALITSSNPRRSVIRSPPSALSNRPRDSVSSASSSSSIPRGTRGSIQSDRDSDASSSRIVPIRGRYVHHHHNASSSTGDRSPSASTDAHTLKEIGLTQKTNLNRRESSESTGREWTQLKQENSPSSLPSSPPPVTPNFTKQPVNGHDSRVEEVESMSNGVVDSRWDEKTAESKRSSILTSPGSPGINITSDRPPQSHAPLRSKRYGQRPTNLRVKRSGSDLKPSNSLFISTENLEPADHLPEANAVTPRAADFTVLSSPEYQPRTRKNSRIDRGVRESEGEEGDDESYSDFLSAYESEDGAYKVTNS